MSAQIIEILHHREEAQKRLGRAGPWTRWFWSWQLGSIETQLERALAEKRRARG